MELEELKQAWKELNEKVEQNELTNRSVIVKMLRRQKETNIQRLWRLQLSAVGAMVIVWAAVGAVYLMNGHRDAPWLFVSVILLVSVASVFWVNGIFRVNKIRNGSSNLEMQLRRILSYKAFVGWNYLVIYMLVIPVIVLLLYYRFTIQLLLTLCVVVSIGAAIDYFLFHRTRNMLENILESSRELQELNSELK